jgi:mono/diheme cytochrome c family protein
MRSKSLNRAESRCRVAVLVALVCAVATVAGADSKGSAAEELFAGRVLPLFKEKCLACHGEDAEKIKGGLDMRSLQGLLQGGDSGKPSIVAGKPEQSPLYLAVTRKHEDDWSAMPPKENDRLTDAQVAYLKDWIAGGAPWPDEAKLKQLAAAAADKWSAEDGVPVKTSGGLADEWTNRRYQPESLWAYRPLAKPELPKLVNLRSEISNRKSEIVNPIDAFLEVRLRELGLEPAPPADRRTLIRRATFDLIGLPPKPAEIAAFVNDPRPDTEAFAEVVERLLASPHYGERWGRHWLDVVRYADSSGFANDYERGNAWRYRDYVIRAFNEDKPYPQFIKEQIAGDELYENAQPGTRNPELLVAAGFLRMGPWELTGMEVARIARQKFLDDVTDSVGQVFLGHTMRCAKCHDHKFDPVPTRDYYSLMGVFATTQLAERETPFLTEENKANFAERQYLQARLKEFQQVAKRLDAKEEAAARKWCEERGLPYIPRNQGLKNGVAEENLPPKHVGFEVEDYGIERISRKGMERLRWELDRYEPYALSVYSGATPEMRGVYRPLRMPGDPMKDGELEKSHILTGGDAFSPAAEVRPGALSALEAFVPALREVKIPQTPTGRRTALAEWIAHPENPLTLRSVVNRIWQWHFNQPIAGNPNNFGATGKPPTHPELLDWLAVTFRDHGGSWKQMHRLILSSEAYRRASSHPDPKLLAEKDPAGTSYAVFQPRRLTAEELRDGMLAVTGELNPMVGGIPNRPEMNLEAALQPRQVMGTFAAAWQPNPKPEQRHRRSIYALRLRGLADPFFEVFNAPGPDDSCEARDASTVTPQVFSLFNSQISYDRAVAFAARLMRERGARNAERGIDGTGAEAAASSALRASRSAIIERAFQLAYGRAPTAEETRACLDHWQKMTGRHRGLDLTKPEYPTEVVRDAVEENTGEKFSFTEKLEFYDDFQPDLKLADVDAETRGLAELCLVLFNANEFVYVY